MSTHKVRGETLEIDGDSGLGYIFDYFWVAVSWRCILLSATWNSGHLDLQIKIHFKTVRKVRLSVCFCLHVENIQVSFFWQVPDQIFSKDQMPILSPTLLDAPKKQHQDKNAHPSETVPRRKKKTPRYFHVVIPFSR